MIRALLCLPDHHLPARLARSSGVCPPDQAIWYPGQLDRSSNASSACQIIKCLLSLRSHMTWRCRLVVSRHMPCLQIMQRSPAMLCCESCVSPVRWHMCLLADASSGCCQCPPVHACLLEHRHQGGSAREGRVAGRGDEVG